MSTQISVRLPDRLVSDLDQLVATGQARSRASVIERALRRELRRLQYEQEAALRDAHPELFEDPDMEALAAWAAHRQFPDLD